MIPGEHLVLIGTDVNAIQARGLGLEIRDTILILLPGPRELFAFLCRTPLEGTVLRNVLKHDCGGLWIDGCRVRGSDLTTNHVSKSPQQWPVYKAASVEARWRHQEYQTEGQKLGRWPSNLLLVHGPRCENRGTKTVESNGHFPKRRGPSGDFSGATGGLDGQQGLRESYTTGEAVASWECQPDCPVKLLDEMSITVEKSRPHLLRHKPRKSVSKGADKAHITQGFSDAGTASRFYPQFANLPEALDWITRLIGAAAC